MAIKDINIKNAYIENIYTKNIDKKGDDIIKHMKIYL